MQSGSLADSSVERARTSFATVGLALFLALCFLGGGCASVDKQWDRAQRKDTREAYAKFIEKNRNSEYAVEAQNRIDDFVWGDYVTRVEAAEDLPDQALVYRDFIRHNRDNRNIPEAKERLHQVMMDIGWREVKDLPSILSYERYLKVYKVTDDHESRPIIEAWAFPRLVDRTSPRMSDLELFVSLFAVPGTQRHEEASLLLEGLAYQSMIGGGGAGLDVYEHFLADYAVFDSKRYREVAESIEVTPVVLASQLGEDERLRELLTHFTGNLEAESNLGWTPLQAAARWNQASSARILIDSGAQCDPPIPAEQKPIAWAANYADKEMAAILIECGAQVNPDDTSSAGGIPLFHAAAHGNRELFHYLLEQGAHPTIVSGDGESALYLAIEASSVSISKQLLQLGSDVNRVSPHGHTALSIAASGRSRMLVARILPLSSLDSKLLALEQSKSASITRQLLHDTAEDMNLDSDDFIVVCTSIANLGYGSGETLGLLGSPLQKLEGMNGQRTRSGEKWIYSETQVSAFEERVVAIHFFDGQATACSIDSDDNAAGPATLRGRYIDGEILFVRYH